ncbi:MAG TPA: ribosome silencing factor [Oligoflexia bacterium]|nr:ribosome silencing factor [Oligoflexia bacterium]
MESRELALACARAAIDKKAEHSLVFDLNGVADFTDYFLITSGQSERQVQAIAQSILDHTRSFGDTRPRVEGLDSGRWVLIDFGDVVVHVFHHYIREFYDLETLWSDARRVNIPKEFYTEPAHAPS